MAQRNFSMVDYFKQLAEKHVPQLSFRGKTREDWEGWHTKAHAKLLKLLGKFPEPADLAPEVVYSVEEDGLIRERVILDTEEHMSVPCVVLKPPGMKADGTNAAILCSHGHGNYGKEPVWGDKSSEGLIQDIERLNYN